MNPTVVGKVFIVSHCYQDFASACVEFHPIFTLPALKKKKGCDTVIFLSISDAS